MNVLIVDDNESAADLLQELVTLQDHTARCAYTARQAIDAAAAEQFDAALIDLTLPDQPGTEVARHLRAAGGGDTMLLIAISGYGAGEAGSDAPGLFDHHLQKPIDLDALERLLTPPAAS